jgi:hypothetical protein
MTAGAVKEKQTPTLCFARYFYVLVIHVHAVGHKTIGKVLLPVFVRFVVRDELGIPNWERFAPGIRYLHWFVCRRRIFRILEATSIVCPGAHRFRLAITAVHLLRVVTTAMCQGVNIEERLWRFL